MRVIRRRAVFIVAVALLLTSSVALGRGPVGTPSAADLQATVETLTSPQMNGRRSGTPGGDLAAARLATWLNDAGLRPAGDTGTYLQSFVLAAGRTLGPLSTLEIDGRRLAPGADWTPHGGSRASEARGSLLFLGYGVSAPGWDEWAAADARDKIVVVLDGVPKRLAGHRVSRLDKLILARQHGGAPHRRRLTPDARHHSRARRSRLGLAHHERRRRDPRTADGGRADGRHRAGVGAGDARAAGGGNPARGHRT
jgi:hypothetical protein